MYVRPFLLTLCLGFTLMLSGPSAMAADSNLREEDLPAIVDRLTWGFTPKELERARKLGVKGYIDAQLTPDLRAPLPREVQERIDALSISRETSEKAFARIEQFLSARRALEDGPEKKAISKKAREISNVRAADTARRAIWLAVYAPNQLHDQMTWFWMNHFNVYAPKGNAGAALSDYEDRAVRPHALGKFRDLLAATMRSPAMLIYLDNQYNRKGRVNENYARELMELHTLGVDGGYTQKDVQELARVLTGSGITYTGTPPKVPADLRAEIVLQGNFLFNPRYHDFGDKHLLGHDIPGTGYAEIDQAVDILARHPATARHISTKLARFFVADRPPKALVDAMAQTFQSSDGDITATLRTMFSSEAFSASLQSGKFKDPVHYVYSSLRLAYGDLPAIARVDTANNWLKRLGQPLYRRITPDGYPLTQSDWSGSGQMTERFDWARRIVAASRTFYQPADEKPAVELAPVPDLPELYKKANRYAGLSPATRHAIENARSVLDANIYLLASPDFMRR